MYDLDIKPEADKIFRKLSKKNKKQLEIISKKITEIRSKPNHQYKFLRKPLQNFNRVHIDIHYVLIFKLNHEDKILTIFYYAHHDEAYDWREK
jgi:YafQ family addiction module toxin component